MECASLLGLLAGRPANGALPWREHITSRHAWWGLQLLLAPAAVPWVAIARALMHCLVLQSTLCACYCSLLGSRRLALWHISLRLTLLSSHWCWAAPLRGNLYFCSPNSPTGIDHDFINFSAAGATSLGQRLHLEQAVAAAQGGAAGRTAACLGA
jgi:hypothetical protein